MNLVVNSSPSQDICFSGEERIRLLCTVVNNSCGTEKLSENDNLGGNGRYLKDLKAYFFPLSICIRE